jgi:acyl-CoA thioesterase-1
MKSMIASILSAFAMIFVVGMAAAQDTPLSRIVALGDSLTSGYGLEAGEDFAAQLQRALIRRGYTTKVENAGIAGDTTAGGLARLAWATAGNPAPSLVIVALGANDLLRGLDPAVTRQNLQAILTELRRRKIPALLVGMKADPTMGKAYQTAFDRIYPDLATAFDVPLYPFFLEGVVMNPALNQADGVHPNPQGVNTIVNKITPMVMEQIRGG